MSGSDTVSWASILPLVPSCLPINVLDLLHRRVVEAPRIELKGTWDKDSVGPRLLETICAFANDFHNLNGGYVVIGVEERGGVPALPPKGLEPDRLEDIQKWVRGNCRRRLDPEYQPVLSPEVVEGRHVLVVWAPASDVRPHTAPSSRDPKKRVYFVRLGAESVEARGQVLTDLLSMAAKVPFDDRLARQYTPTDLRASLVREFLRETRSALLDEQDDLEIYRHMRLTTRINEHEVPRNVALMFFSDDPERAFRGARIEVVHFAEDGDVLEEDVFGGPLHRQVRDCLRFLGGRVPLHVEKVPDRPETNNWTDYPLPALEEAIVNAVYHRSYEAPPEPTKVYVHDDRIEVTSYPGPVPGLEPKHLEPGAKMPAVTARNRRIGELFKDLRMAEARGTGVRKIHGAMAANGSPPPLFQFDAERTYFTLVLPIHPAAVRPATSRPMTGQEGLVLISVGGESIRPAVEESLESSSLRQARVLVDLALPDYVERWDAVARQVRDAVRKGIEAPGVGRLHLFYHGPLALAPLLGALAASSSRPTVVYHFEHGRYGPAYTIDRRFLKAQD